MKKIGLKLIFTLLFVLNYVSIYAIQDSLILYTKPDCSNCRDTKQALNEAGINFIEKTLNNDKFADEMLHKLSIVGYHKEIYLPVIFLNKQLLHPAYKTANGLITLSLQSVADSLKSKYLRGELNLAIDNTPKISTTENQSQFSSDCELKVPTIYLICDSFSGEIEAKNEMNQLISEGYSFAGIIFYHNQYRVFSKFYSTKTLADNDLIQLKKRFQNAYLFEMQ